MLSVIGVKGNGLWILGYGVACYQLSVICYLLSGGGCWVPDNY
jgi:hypothetical protein